jgi:WD40 repeat protein/serine/threonine protein kinase
MSLLSNLLGKSKKNLPENLSLSTPAEKPSPEPARGGTTLRKQEDTSPPQKKAGPELSALEMAERQSWEVKRLPVWKPGDEILGLYRVEDVIETGGMGRVYIAHHKSWNVKLSIKSPNEMMLSDRNNFARVLREANSWTELGLHPNIAYCYYVRSIEEVPHIFVEYVDGGNLRQWIAEGKCIDYWVSLDLAIQFCHGMEHAHSKGMIHRDIKPENVLMTKDGILKIADFGLVRTGATIGDGQGKGGVSAKGMTRLGDVMGTEGFMAPEQFTHAAGADERADIFSFGVCLYEMCCGARPYDITIGEYKDAPDPIKLSRDAKFPPALSEVLIKCVQWERDKRYGTFKEIRERLNTIYRDLFNQESFYAELELVDLEADNLNNRGVSYFELGRKEEALSCWEQVISLNRTHLEATYNHGLILWRDAKIADDEVLRRLENCGGNPSADKQRLAEFKAFIHAERPDFDAAREVLKGFPGRFDALFSGKDIPAEASVRTLQGHTSSVTSVAMSPDGRHIVSGSEDNTLRVWDLVTGRCLNTLQGHTGEVESVAVSPDGRHIVSGSSDSTLRVWELGTGRCLNTLKGHTSGVESVAVSPDGRHIVSGNLDKILRVWELETGRCLNTLQGHTHWVYSVAVSPDGRHIVSGSYDETLRVWELGTGRCLKTLQGHTEGARSVAVSPDGRHIVSGNWDKTLRVWEFVTGRCLNTLQGHTEKVFSVAVSPDGRHIVSGSFDKTLRVWDLGTGRCLNTFQGHTNWVKSVAVSPDGRHIVSGSADHTLRVWRIYFDRACAADLQVSLLKGFAERKREKAEIEEAVCKAGGFYEKGDYKRSFSILFEIWKANQFSDIEPIRDLYSSLLKKGKISGLHFAFQKRLLEGHTNEVNSVAVSPDGRHIVSGSSDNILRVWELETGSGLNTLQGHRSWIFSVAVSPDGRHIVSGSYDKTLRVWELGTARCLNTLQGHTSSVNSVAVSPDGLHIVSGSSDNTLRVWDIETGRCLNTLQGHRGSVYSIAVSPDGRHIVSGSYDKTLRVWELGTARCLNTLQGHTDAVDSVAMSPHGRQIVSGSRDLTLRVWDLGTGRCLTTLQGHTEGARSVAVSPDGRHIVSGSWDKTLRVWELGTGRCLTTLQGHTNYVKSVAVSPDGRYIVSGSSDNTLRVWELIWALEFGLDDAEQLSQ